MIILPKQGQVRSTEFTQPMIVTQPKIDHGEWTVEQQPATYQRSQHVNFMMPYLHGVREGLVKDVG